MSDPICGCQPNEQDGSSTVNVGVTERIASATVGGFLLAVGLGSSHLWLRIAALAAGAGFVYRGFSGNCLTYRLLATLRKDARKTADAEIDEAGEESFPASDPPSFIASTASPSRRLNANDDNEPSFGA